MEREVKDWVEEEGDEYSLQILLLCSLLAQRVKRLTTMQETWVRYLGGEDPLEKKMATFSSILAWKNQWTEETSGLQSIGLQRVRHD